MNVLVLRKRLFYLSTHLLAMNYPSEFSLRLIVLWVFMLFISCSDAKMSNTPVYSFETQEVYDKQNIYLVAFEIMNDNIKHAQLIFTNMFCATSFEIVF